MGGKGGGAHPSPSSQEGTAVPLDVTHTQLQVGQSSAARFR